MRYLLALAILVSAALPQAAQAEDWPVHGDYYRVESVGEGADRLCRLRVEVSVNGLPFAFILSQHGTRPWQAQVMARDESLIGASQVLVGFDRKTVFRFTPTRRNPSPELSSLTGEVTEADNLIEQLRQVATTATWFQVAALPYAQAVPAVGMKDALDDLAACRAARRT